MGRSITSLVCFAVVAAGCGSAPAPVGDAEREFAAAPSGEVAPPDLAGDTEPAPQPALAFARSIEIDHEWTSESGKRVRVSFCVSMSAPVDDAMAALASYDSNWPAACDRAREICESSNLFDQAGQLACEDELCSAMTEALFPAGDGTVERIIWNRVTWR